MRYFSIFLFILGLTFQAGCTSQARKTHLVFENENATYDELNKALEELKPVGHEGAAHLQYKAVKALRHIAKYMRDPAKRELGVQGLAFLASFTDDGDVEEAAESRLDAILDNENEEMAIRVAVINGKKNVVLGKTGYTIDDSSIFSSKVVYKFIYPETGAREDALEFLIDRFEDLPEYLQFVTVQAFGEILANPTICFEKEDGRCEDDDAEDQEEWKEDLREEFGDWLEDAELSEMINTALIRLIGETTQTTQSEESPVAKTWLETWLKNDDIPEKTREIVQAALDKLENRHPDLVDPASDSEDDGKDKYKADESYKSLDIFDKNAFWYGNSGKILDEQLFKTGKTAQGTLSEMATADSELMQVPAEWLLFDGYTNEETSKALRDIIFYQVAEALSRGYVLSHTNDQLIALEQLLTTAADESIWALDRTLSVTAKLYPSLLRHQEDMQSHIDFLMGRISTAPDIHTRRLYYDTILEGLPYFQPIIEPALCSSLNDTDLLTRQMVKDKVIDLQAPLELISIKKYREMQEMAGQTTEAQVDDSEKEMSSEESAPYIKSFCGEELTRKTSNEMDAKNSAEDTQPVTEETQPAPAE